MKIQLLGCLFIFLALPAFANSPSAFETFGRARQFMDKGDLLDIAKQNAHENADDICNSEEPGHAIRVSDWETSLTKEDFFCRHLPEYSCTPRQKTRLVEVAEANATFECG